MSPSQKQLKGSDDCKFQPHCGIVVYQIFPAQKHQYHQRTNLTIQLSKNVNIFILIILENKKRTFFLGDFTKVCVYSCANKSKKSIKFK